MPKPLSQKQLAELMRSMPGASEEEVLRAALQKEFEEDIPAPHIPVEGPKGPGPIPPVPFLNETDGQTGARMGRQMAAKFAMPLYNPKVEEVEYTPTQDAYSMAKVGALPMPEKATALTPKGYAQVVGRELSTPDLALGLGAGKLASMAGRAGLLGISKGARVLEALSNVPAAAIGTEMLVSGESLPEKTIGAGVAALGGVGASSAFTHSFPVGKVRDAYLKKQGRPIVAPDLPATWDQDLAIRTADAYEAMKHAPNDPQVRAAYESLANEVRKQFDFITKDAGLRITPSAEPYPSSAGIVEDITKNNHLRYLPTETAYGQGEVLDNPLTVIDPDGIPVNDKFRVVHDYLGHGPGHQTGPLGERRAYAEHRVTMPDQPAIDALTTETHGQNSWVNAGKHIRRADGSIPKKGDPDFVHPSQRPFAEQKSGLLPRHIIDTPEYRFLDAETLTGPNTPLADGTPYGIVSAGNPGVTLSDAENAARHAALKQDVRAEFYRPLDQTGMFDNPEPSVLVPGLTPEATTRLGKKYGQVSSISSEGYHRHADDATFGRTGPVVFDPEAENYYSELHEVLLSDGRRVKYQMQFPDEAYGPPPGSGSGASTGVPESVAASPEPSSRTSSVEDTIQRQADAPAGSLAGNDIHRIDPDSVDTSGIQLLGDDATPVGVNASGESAASTEAQHRLAQMKAKGERFAFRGPGGVIRPVAETVDAVDLQAPKGWEKGIIDKDGKFRLYALAAPAAAIGMPSTGDEETDALIRMALLGSSTAVLLKAPQVQKLVTALPELQLGRFMRRTADGLYRLTDEAIQNLRQWYERSGKIPGARGVWAKQNEMLAPAFDGQTGIQRQFNYLQAATSPRTELAQSTQEALAALAAGLRNPMAEVTPESMAEEGLRTIHNSGSKMPNVNRALRGEMLQSGNHIGKAQEYGDLVNMGLGGTPEELQRGLLANPPDLHGMGMIDESLEGDFSAFRPEMREFFAFHEGTPAPGQRGAINPQGIYDRFREARTAGWQEAVPGVPVSEAFADAWGARRHALGIEDGTMTPADMLIMRGLGEPGALLDPDLIRYALMRQDWPTTGSAGLASARSRKRGHR